MASSVSSGDSPVVISADTTTNKMSGGSAAAIAIGVVLGLILLLCIIVDIRRRVLARRNRRKIRRLALLAQDRWTIEGEKDTSPPNSWSGEKYFKDLEATPPGQTSGTSPSSGHYNTPALPPKAVTYIPGKKVGNLSGVLMTQAPIEQSRNQDDFRLPRGLMKTDSNGGWSRINPPGLVSQSQDSNQTGITEYGPTQPMLMRHPSVRSQKANISRPRRMELGTLSPDPSAQHRQYLLQPKVEITPPSMPPQDGSAVPDITLSPATPRVPHEANSNWRSQ